MRGCALGQYGLRASARARRVSGLRMAWACMCVSRAPAHRTTINSLAKLNKCFVRDLRARSTRANRLFRSPPPCPNPHSPPLRPPHTTCPCTATRPYTTSRHPTHTTPPSPRSRRRVNSCKWPVACDRSQTASTAPCCAPSSRAAPCAPRPPAASSTIRAISILAISRPGIALLACSPVCR